MGSYWFITGHIESQRDHHNRDNHRRTSTPHSIPGGLRETGMNDFYLIKTLSGTSKFVLFFRCSAGGAHASQPRPNLPQHEDSPARGSSCLFLSSSLYKITTLVVPVLVLGLGRTCAAIMILRSDFYCIKNETCRAREAHLWRALSRREPN
jgi:hypothetical protein